MSHWFCFWIQVVSTSSSESTSCASSFRMTVPVRQWKKSWPGVKYSALPACARSQNPQQSAPQTVRKRVKT